MTPWPWTAPEALLCGVYSTESDMYMLGVVIWELLTQGRDPYNWREVRAPLKLLAQILGGETRHEMPPNPPEAIASKAHECLHPSAALRPSAAQVADRMAALIHIKDLQCPTDRGPTMTEMLGESWP